jgi:hypothetical protein
MKDDVVVNRMVWPKETSGLCANCGNHPGTIQWGDALALTHGWAKMWCKGCGLRAQIAHIEERLLVLDGLRADLRRWDLEHP